MPDREKVIKSLELCADGHHCHECSYQTVKHNLDGIADCTSLLADHALALLKEQEAVVRCKDCKFWHQSLIPGQEKFGDCGQANGLTVKWADWFCADGERKET